MHLHTGTNLKFENPCEKYLCNPIFLLYQIFKEQALKWLMGCTYFNLGFNDHYWYSISDRKLKKKKNDLYGYFAFFSLEKIQSSWLMSVQQTESF